MKNPKKIANPGTYDNTAAIKSFKDATANALTKHPYTDTIAKVGDPVTETGLYAALKASGKTDAEKAIIKNDINVLHDLVMLYLDTESATHKYVTTYTLSVNVGYSKTLTDYKDGTHQFPQNVYFSVLTTGGLFKATSVNKVFTTCPAGTSCTTASNCTPICNFPNSNTDATKPNLAFMDNFDVIYKAISDEITTTPAPAAPCINACECGQFVDTHCYIGEGYVSKNAPNYDCPDLINKGGSITAETSMNKKPLMKCDNTAGSSTNGCCFWGRGAVQLTGLRNYGIADQVIANNAAALSSLSLKSGTICSNPEIVCQDSTYQWFSTLTFWVNSVQGYTFPSDSTPEQTPYQTQLEAYITLGCPTDSASLEPTPSSPSGTDCRDMEFKKYLDPKEMYPFAMGCFGAVNAGYWNGKAGLWHVRLKAFINIMNKLKAQTQYPFTASISSGSIKEIYAAAGMTTMDEIAKIMVTGNPLKCKDNSEDVPPKIPTTFKIDTLWNVLNEYTNLPVDSTSTIITSQFWDKKDDHRYGAVGLAALLANAFEETGNLATCDETNWGNTCDYCTNSAGEKCS